MKVASRTDAWEVADEIFRDDYILDQEASERAGYDIWKAPATSKHTGRIADLGSRLEVIFDDVVTNIWIDDVSARKAVFTYKKNPDINVKYWQKNIEKITWSEARHVLDKDDIAGNGLSSDEMVMQVDFKNLEGIKETSTYIARNWILTYE